MKKLKCTVIKFGTHSAGNWALVEVEVDGYMVRGFVAPKSLDAWAEGEEREIPEVAIRFQ